MKNYPSLFKAIKYLSLIVTILFSCPSIASHFNEAYHSVMYIDELEDFENLRNKLSRNGDEGERFDWDGSIEIERQITTETLSKYDDKRKIFYCFKQQDL